jgi:hypothetical protein
MADITTLLSKFLEQLYAGNVQASGDGTASLPAYSFASEVTLGFWRSAAATTTHQGALIVTGNLGSSGTVNTAGSGAFFWSTRALMRSPVNGVVTVSNFAETIGSELKVDALPTVGSGFGTSPAVIAGSTPLAGAVNVGTGGSATTGVITFGGTAFPSTPFVVCTCSLGAVPTVCVATTTNLTFTTSVAWPASTILNWIVISSK